MPEWRIEPTAGAEWDAAVARHEVRVWLLSPDTHGDATAAELHAALQARLANHTGGTGGGSPVLVLSQAEIAAHPRHARTAAFVVATAGAPACVLLGPSVPPLSPSSPPHGPSPQSPPPPPPLAAPPRPSPAAPGSCLALSMFDSFSDGWNGVSLRLRPLTETFTLASGSRGVAMLCALEAGEYEPVIEGGTATERQEASWQLEGCVGGRRVQAHETPRLEIDAGGGGCRIIHPSPPPPPPHPPPPTPPATPTARHPAAATGVSSATHAAC